MFSRSICMRLGPVVAVVAFLACGMRNAAAQNERPPPLRDIPRNARVYDFEDGLEPWQAAPGARLKWAGKGSFLNRGNRYADLVMQDSMAAVLRLRPPENEWLDISSFERMRFDVYLPSSRSGMHAEVHFVDRDDCWYQSRRPCTHQTGKWVTCEIDLRREVAAFSSVGHARPWGRYPAHELQEIGIHIFAERPVSGHVGIDNIVFLPRSGPTPEQAIYNFETSGSTVGQYEKFEVTFELARFYENPFDPDQIRVQARFEAPSGAISVAQGFFFQDFERQLAFETIKGIAKKVEKLTPRGSPKWKIRFAPKEIGTYKYRIEIDDGKMVRTSTKTFACVPSKTPGCVRVCAADPRYFEFEDGSFYYPIGHNIPATFNVKASKLLGVTIEEFEGTYAFDRYLDGMVRGRENFARICMTAWSFAIEWSPRYRPDYRGLGRYSLENAWRLDYVLNKAERNGVYLQVGLTTFGHWRSDKFEGDWKHSPYNVANGGFLRRPVEFWISSKSSRAQAMYDRMLRYAMARWGYSSHIAGWEICNEIDLADDTMEGKKKTLVVQPVVAWYERCVKVIREYDPSPNLITANFSYWADGPGLLRNSFISYTSTNSYASNIIDVMRKEIFPMKASMGKPAIMTECGYHWDGAPPETTVRYLHLCLWSSYMMPFAGSGMPWWWDFIDSRDLYDRFRPLAEFAKGEDKRGRNLEMAKGIPVDAKGHPVPMLTAEVLKNDHSGYFWIYENRLQRKESDFNVRFTQREGVALHLGGMADGSYRIEFWDTYKGGCVHEVTASAKNGVVICPAPAFTSDIAGKIKPLPSPKE